MKQIMKRSLSLVLTAALLLAFLPASGSAQELTEQGQTEISALPETTDTTIAETSGKEVVAFRTENEKHYDMGGGVYQAIAYSHPVHQMDENGKWQDIDVSLSLSQTRSGSLYTNKAAGVAFPSVYSQGQPIFSLTGDGSTIAMSLTGDGKASRTASTVVPQVKNPQNSFRTLEDANNAKFSSSIIYSDVLPGVDLEYIVGLGTVKENIIVKESADSYRYTFTLNLAGLIPVMQQDGGILLFPTGSDTPEYVIPAPYMYDALGNFSEAVTYTLLGNGSTYTLTVTADESWINAKGRSFPVTIDPSVQRAISLVYDTTIDSGMPDTTRATTSTLWVNAQRTPFIKCMTPSLPANATIQWARLTAYYYYYDYVSSGMVNVSAHQVVGGDWNQYTLTWNGVADLPNLGLSTTTLSFVSAAAGNATINNPGRADFYITPVFQAWVNNPSINYGIALRYMASSVNSSVIFHSANSTSGYAPKFEYRYSSTDYYATVETYFDNGYSVFYGETNARSESKIRSYLTAVNNRYLDLFGLQLNISTVSYYNSPIDQCKGTVSSNNINTLCGCGANHTDTETAMFNFKQDHLGASTIPTIYWSAHRFTTPIADTTVVVENRSYSSEDNALLIDRFESNRDQLSTSLLMHEMNHLFGAKDHYHDASKMISETQCANYEICSQCADEKNKRPPTCIMADTDANINTSTVLCRECYQDILNHLEGHHSLGG